MSDELIKVMEREDQNVELFSILDKNLLLETVVNDLKTSLKDLLVGMFSNQLSGKSREVIFNAILRKCLQRLDDEINRIKDFNRKELIVWHKSVFMSLKSFGNSVSTRFTIEDHQEIIRLFNEILNTSFYKFLD